MFGTKFKNIFQYILSLFSIFAIDHHLLSDWGPENCFINFSQIYRFVGVFCGMLSPDDDSSIQCIYLTTCDQNSVVAARMTRDRKVVGSISAACGPEVGGPLVVRRLKTSSLSVLVVGFFGFFLFCFGFFGGGVFAHTVSTM